MVACRTGMRGGATVPGDSKASFLTIDISPWVGCRVGIRGGISKSSNVGCRTGMVILVEPIHSDRTLGSVEFVTIITDDRSISLDDEEESSTLVSNDPVEKELSLSVKW